MCSLREGTGQLAVKEKRTNPVSIPKPEKRSGRGKTDSQVGRTLRSVYQQTVGEDIPTEMLDLLGKLK